MLGQNMQDFHSQISKVWHLLPFEPFWLYQLLGDLVIFNLYDMIAFRLQSRQELEQHSVDTASTSDAVTFITYVQTLKRKIKQFEKNVDVSSSTHFTLYPMSSYQRCLLQIP